MNKDQDRPRMGPRGRIIWRYWLPWPLMPCKKKGPRAHKSSARRFPSTGDANARIASAHQWIEIGTRRKTNIKIFNINNIESIPLALICNGKTGFSPKKNVFAPPGFFICETPGRFDSEVMARPCVSQLAVKRAALVGAGLRLEA
jgi:hypothetical protein